MAAEWHTLTGRLRWAVGRLRGEGRQRGLREFQRRMKQTGAPGISLSQIQSYLRGTEPSVSFLQAAAGKLGVRAEWLAFGTGKPTEAEEAASRAARERASVLASSAEEVFRARLPWDFMGEAGRAQVWKLWGVLTSREMLGHPPIPLPSEDAEESEYEGFVRAAAECAARAVLAPADAAGIELPLGTDAVESYVVNVCEALFSVLVGTMDGDVEED